MDFLVTLLKQLVFLAFLAGITFCICSLVTDTHTNVSVWQTLAGIVSGH